MQYRKQLLFMFYLGLCRGPLRLSDRELHCKSALWEELDTMSGPLKENNRNEWNENCWAVEHASWIFLYIQCLSRSCLLPDRHCLQSKLKYLKTSLTSPACSLMCEDIMYHISWCSFFLRTRLRWRDKDTTSRQVLDEPADRNIKTSAPIIPESIFNWNPLAVQ